MAGDTGVIDGWNDRRRPARPVCWQSQIGRLPSGTCHELAEPTSVLDSELRDHSRSRVPLCGSIDIRNFIAQFAECDRDKRSGSIRDQPMAGEKLP